jgi:membrane protein DedA with SNARE-associated domain
MTTFIFSILSYILLYKYVALFLVAYLAALLIPLPSNTSLLAASAFASQGYLNIYIVIVVAFLANEAGDLTGFFIARKYGKGMLMKIGFRKIMISEKYEQLEKFIVLHSRITIFVTRFVGGIGPLVNILTGLSEKIHFKRFLVYGVAGEFVYVMTLSLTGYFVGSAWEDVTSTLEIVSLVGAGLLILFVIKKMFFQKMKF